MILILTFFLNYLKSLGKITGKLARRRQDDHPKGGFARGEQARTAGMYPEDQEILIVDSDEARRKLTGDILRDEGFTVTAVSEGLAALRAVGRRRFALVIAAVHLPGTLDGLTTVRQARARQPGLKALFTEDYARMPRRGDPDADDFIAAPFHRWEMLGCVFELLQRDGIAGAADLARRCRTKLRV